MRTDVDACTHSRARGVVDPARDTLARATEL